MVEKFTLEEIKDNLLTLQSRLERKGRENGFWVVATRTDFKPIKLEESIRGKITKKILVKKSDIKKELLDGKEQYFRGKRLAFIEYWINPFLFSDSKKYSEKNYSKITNESICAISVTIFIIDGDGKIDTKSANSWRCRVNFTVDDMSKHKLTISDAEIIMRQVSDYHIMTEDFYGIIFKNYVKLLKKYKSK